VGIREEIRNSKGDINPGKTARREVVRESHLGWAWPVTAGAGAQQKVEGGGKGGGGSRNEPGGGGRN